MILKKCAIVHVPKTGGTWIRRSLKKAYGPIIFIPERNKYSHPPLEMMQKLYPDMPKFTIAFVRNPLTWWQSYWTFRVETTWGDKVRKTRQKQGRFCAHPIIQKTSELDAKCKHGDFNAFMYNVLKYYPGHCSNLYEIYIGTPKDQVSYVGRFENLVDDTVTALNVAGENFEESKLRKVGKQRFGKYKKSVEYDPDLKKKVIQAESKAIHRFGY